MRSRSPRVAALTARRLWTLGLCLFLSAGCDRSATENPAAPDPTTSTGPVDPPPSKPLPGGTSTSLPVNPPISAEDLSKKTVDELLAMAEASFDPEEQVKILDAALQKDPKNRKALTMGMVITQSEGQAIMQRDRQACLPKFDLSAGYAKRLLDAHSDFDPQVTSVLRMALYNGACARALADKKEESLAFLRDAIEVGFNQGIIETDSDLDSIRGTPEFAKLMEKFRENQTSGILTEMASFKSFPFDFKITDVDGKTVSKADLKGKVSIVDFWGTWCPPCRDEIPHFVELLDQYRDQGLAIVGLNYENGDTDEKTVKLIRDSMKEYKMNYPCGLVDEQTMNMVPDFNAFPTTLFLDRAGNVRFKMVGLADKAQLEAVVKALLNEEAAEAEKPESGE